MTNLDLAAWNVTQYIKNALTSLPSLRACIPSDSADAYDTLDLNEDIDRLESDLDAALTRAQDIINQIETITEGNKNESN